MFKKALLTLLLVLAFQLFSSTNPSLALACKCAEAPEPQAALDAATAVFTGHVRELKKSDDKLNQEATIDVMQTLKGTIPAVAIVKTPESSASCGFAFEKDSEYLIYANETDGTLSVSSCSRTKSLISGIEEISILSNAKAQAEAANPNGEEDASNKLVYFSFTLAAAVILIPMALALIFPKKVS